MIDTARGIGGEGWSFGRCLSYGLLSMPLALMGITFYVYLPKFYADHAGLSLGLIGVVVLVSRVWDALIDPLMGSISDATRHKLGRRRPWIAGGALPLMLSFVLLLTPSLSPVSPAIWFAAWTFLFFIFWTMVIVPYEALGAELSFVYDERTRILSIREGSLVLGTLLAGALPLGYEALFPSSGDPEKFFRLSIGYAILLGAAAWLCVARLSERNFVPTRVSDGHSGNPSAAAEAPSSMRLVGLKLLRENAPFRVLLIAYTIGAIGGALPATLIMFYVEQVLGSTRGSLFLALYFAVGLVCLPAWVALAKRIGKKEAWIGAMAINGGAFSAVFFLGSGDEFLYAICIGLSAIGYGATLALPSSMQADVIDFDELISGERREGQFVGLWSVARKLSAALGAGVALGVLHLTGYEGSIDGLSAAPAQNSATLLALRIMYAAVPSIANFAAIAVAWNYSIDREGHQRIRSEIDQRKAGERA